MARVLMVGIDPDQVDYSDPALPPGLDADTIRRAIASGLDELRCAGHDAHHVYISADASGAGELAEQLARDPVDCVVVGGGVRLPPRNLVLFEALLNTIARASPQPAVALIARPEESAHAAARVLGRGNDCAGPPPS